MYEIILKGNPLSTSHIYKFHSRGGYMTREGRQLKDSYESQARLQWPRETLSGAILLEIHLYFGDRRRRDIDNYHKLSLDSLSGIAYEDDVQIQRMVVEKKYDKENPRIHLWVTPY